MLIINYLSVYKTVYKFFRVSTSLIANDLNVYVNDNGAARNDCPQRCCRCSEPAPLISCAPSGHVVSGCAGLFFIGSRPTALSMFGSGATNCGRWRITSTGYQMPRRALLLFPPSEKFGHFRVRKNHIRVALQGIEIMAGKTFAAFGGSQQNFGFVQQRFNRCGG
jgi:hypothetical protein